ncbi:histone H3-like centromeric protein A [Armigeres subalbatus]|uniref:histone H3-like centromeric protein A n=1 Tax=Armigeres subalbatus TaxID=124917 RepID=UPI002ED1AE0B
MPRHIRPPQRYVPGGKVHTLRSGMAESSKPVPKPAPPSTKTAKAPKSAPKRAVPQPPTKAAELQKPAPKAKQQEINVAEHKRRSRSETRTSSEPSARTRQSSEEPQRVYESQNIKVLRDIHHLQSTTQLLIPKLSFARVIREVLMQYSHRDFRITAECLMAMQEAAEIYMVQVYEDSYRCCLHRDRVTLGVQDMKLALYLRERWNS